MPYYEDLSALPKGVKDNLPLHARVIYRNAFNNAWDEYRDPDNRFSGSLREATAARVAWASVKKLYEKDKKTGHWKRKGSKAKVKVHA